MRGRFQSWDAQLLTDYVVGRRRAQTLKTWIAHESYSFWPPLDDAIALQSLEIVIVDPDEIAQHRVRVGTQKRRGSAVGNGCL